MNYPWLPPFNEYLKLASRNAAKDRFPWLSLQNVFHIHDFFDEFNIVFAIVRSLTVAVVSDMLKIDKC